MRHQAKKAVVMYSVSVITVLSCIHVAVSSTKYRAGENLKKNGKTDQGEISSIWIDSQGRAIDANGNVVGTVNSKDQIVKSGKPVGLSVSPKDVAIEFDSEDKPLGYIKDDGTVIRTDGSELKTKKPDDAVVNNVNLAIQRKMDNFAHACGWEGSGDDAIKEIAYMIDEKYTLIRVDNGDGTSESVTSSYTYDQLASALAFIHNHPSENGKSHAWPSVMDAIGLVDRNNMIAHLDKTARQKKDSYIVDCFDKNTLVRLDGKTGKVMRVLPNGAGREVACQKPRNLSSMDKARLESVKSEEDFIALLRDNGFMHSGYDETAWGLIQTLVSTYPDAIEKSKSHAMGNVSNTEQQPNPDDFELDTSRLEAVTKDAIAYMEAWLEGRVWLTNKEFVETACAKFNALFSEIELISQQLERFLQPFSLTEQEKFSFVSQVSKRREWEKFLPLIKRKESLVGEVNRRLADYGSRYSIDTIPITFTDGNLIAEPKQ